MDVEAHAAVEGLKPDAVPKSSSRHSLSDKLTMDSTLEGASNISRWSLVSLQSLVPLPS